MAKLSRPQAPARFRAMFPDLADWLESPSAGPPPFLAGQVFRLEESAGDDRYVIRPNCPGWTRGTTSRSPSTAGP